MSPRKSLLCLLLAAIFVAGPVLAEEDEPTPNDMAKDFAKEFKKSLKHQTEAELFEGVDQLAEYYMDEQVDDKGAKKAIMEAFSKVAFLRNKAVVAHFVKVCEKLDTEVVKLVVAVLKKELKSHAPNEQVYEAALDTIGKLHSEDPRVVKALTDLYKHKDSSVIARAFYATSLYAPTSGRTRKGMFEEVLKQTEGVHAQSLANNDTAKRKWTICGQDGMEALNKLSVPPRTVPDFKTPVDARQWFNDNKKIPWDRQD